MLSFIVEAFQALFNFIVSAFEILMLFIDGLHTSINLLTAFLVSIPSYFFWLPESVVALIVTIFGVIVFYKVAGREG